MIYICIITHNNSSTIGLLLWKIRQVFVDFPRQYQLLVVDDGSTDDTAAVLRPYSKSLPLTVFTHSTRRGRAASFEAVLREALERSDRHKRDCVVTLPPDFSVSPTVIPELIKRFESGADVVVGEMESDREPLGDRVVRRLAPWLLSPGINLPGVKDLVSGCGAFRLVTIKKCVGEDEDPVLQTEGACTFAEVLARTSSLARQITTEGVDRGPSRKSAHDHGPVVTAFNLLQAGRRLSIPAPESTAMRGT